MRFKKGNPGGPGRPRGSRNRSSILLKRLGQHGVNDLVDTAREEAKGGDTRLLVFLLNRLLPRPQARTVEIDLPTLNGPADVVAAQSALVRNVASGKLSPEEAQAVSVLIENRRRAAEDLEVDATLAALKKEIEAQRQERRRAREWDRR